MSLTHVHVQGDLGNRGNVRGDLGNRGMYEEIWETGVMYKEIWGTGMLQTSTQWQYLQRRNFCGHECLTFLLLRANEN